MIRKQPVSMDDEKNDMLIRNWVQMCKVWQSNSLVITSVMGCKLDIIKLGDRELTKLMH